MLARFAVPGTICVGRGAAAPEPVWGSSTGVGRPTIPATPESGLVGRTAGDAGGFDPTSGTWSISAAGLTGAGERARGRVPALSARPRTIGTAIARRTRCIESILRPPIARRGMSDRPATTRILRPMTVLPALRPVSTDAAAAFLD